MRWTSLAAVACASCMSSEDPSPVDPNDVDGDGIPNAVDLCPYKQDPRQHDEDFDGVGDACDNCPATPNADQADTTETMERQFPDGVGDACDRRPKIADDTIARFYPFAVPAEANEFTGSGWTIANDRASGTTARWFSKRSAPGDGITMQAKIGKLAWAMPDASVAVVVDGDGVTAGFTCTILHAATGDTLEVREIGGAVNSKAIDGLAPTDQITLSVTRVYTQLATGTAACFLGVNNAPELRIDIVTTDDLAIGTYAVATTDAMVVLTAALVMTTPFACDAPRPGPGLGCPVPP